MTFPFGRLWLSPMEGVSDLGFRTICSQQGASLTFTEMIRASSFVQGNKATINLVDTHTSPPKTGIQFLVAKKEILQQSLALLRQGMEKQDGRFSNLSVVDLNFGCPSPEIIQIGQGPALLKRTSKMKELLSTLRKESPLPCGIKIRLGLNEREKKLKLYLRIVEMANEIGLDYLTVHPKTAADNSLTPIDWTALQEIIDHSTIPIVGNGFVTDGPKAKKMLDLGCKAVMIARASVGNPWIFSEINDFLQGKERIIKKDYDSAWRTYDSIVKKYGTGKKYYDYHQKMFQLRKQGDLSYHSPSRILQWV